MVPLAAPCANFTRKKSANSKIKKSSRQDFPSSHCFMINLFLLLSFNMDTYVNRQCSNKQKKERKRGPQDSQNTYRYRAFSLAQPSRLASLLNSRLQNRKKRLTKSIHKQRSYGDVSGLWHQSIIINANDNREILPRLLFLVAKLLYNLKCPSLHPSVCQKRHGRIVNVLGCSLINING